MKLVAAHGVSAQDKYTVKVRDGLALSDFKRSADAGR